MSASWHTYGWVMHFTQEDILEYYGLIRVLTRIKYTSSERSQTVFCSTGHKKAWPCKTLAREYMVFLSTKPMVSLHCRSSYFVDVANLGLGVCLCVCVCGGAFHLYRCHPFISPHEHTRQYDLRSSGSYSCFYIFLFPVWSPAVMNRFAGVPLWSPQLEIKH